MKYFKIFITLLISFFVLNACQENNGIDRITGLEQESFASKDAVSQSGSQTVVGKLNLLSKGFSSVAANKAIREILNSKFIEERANGNHEAILNVKEVISLQVSGKSIAAWIIESDVFSSVNQTENLKEEDLIHLVDDISPQVDIYFPVREHKESWYRNSGNLLVAYTDPDNEWGEIKAYNSTGDSQFLSPYLIPQIPVMVVSVCEHRSGHKAVKYLRPLDDPGDDPGDGQGGGGGSSSETKIYFEWVRMSDFQEPWINGDPEFKMWFAITESSWLDFFFGDEYGYWNIFGYHRYIDVYDWNHKGQYMLTKPENGGDEYNYASVKIIEEDTGDATVNFNLEVPLDSKLLGTKGKLAIKYKTNDDMIGQNTFLKVYGSPLYSDRNQTPDYREVPVAGYAWVNFWW